MIFPLCHIFTVWAGYLHTHAEINILIYPLFVLFRIDPSVQALSVTDLKYHISLMPKLQQKPQHRGRQRLPM